MQAKDVNSESGEDYKESTNRELLLKILQELADIRKEIDIIKLRLPPTKAEKDQRPATSRIAAKRIKTSFEPTPKRTAKKIFEKPAEFKKSTKDVKECSKMELPKKEAKKEAKKKAAIRKATPKKQGHNKNELQIKKQEGTEKLNKTGNIIISDEQKYMQPIEDSYLRQSCFPYNQIND